MPDPPSGDMILSSDHLASRAVNGVPSCQVTLGRILKVYSVASGFTSQLSARRGCGVNVKS